MRRFKAYTRNYGDQQWLEAARFWTRNGAERWAVANEGNLFNYWKIDTKR